MNVIFIALLCTVLCILLLFVKSLDAKLSHTLSLVFCVFLTVYIYSEASGTIEYIKEISNTTSLGRYMPYIFKSVAIGFVCQSCTDICSDAGETAVGKTINTAGKLAIAAVCLPLVKEIISEATGYIQ